MSAINRAALVALLNTKVVSGYRSTSAQGVRDQQNAIIESLVSLIDDKDANSGYLGIDSNGRVDVTKINSASSASVKQVLQSDGTWKNQHAGRSTFNGTGAQTKFNVTHGGGFTPTSVTVTPGSSDSAKVCYVDNFTPTQFDVTFLVAPTGGTNNVIINFNIE